VKTTILCACVDADNRPRRDCDLGCGGTGVLCSRCQGHPGRWLDDHCPDCDGYGPAPDTAPSAEALRLSNLMATYVA
jgi:hypothetical protein